MVFDATVDAVGCGLPPSDKMPAETGRARKHGRLVTNNGVHREDARSHGRRPRRREVGRAPASSETLGAVCTHRKKISARRGPWRPHHELKEARARPSLMSSGSPSSRIGTSPFLRRATRSESMSAQRTRGRGAGDGESTPPWWGRPRPRRDGELSIVRPQL